MIYDGTGMKNRKGPLLDPALADKHCSVTNGQADEPEPQQQNSGTNSGTSAHDNISQCQTVSNSAKRYQTMWNDRNYLLASPIFDMKDFFSGVAAEHLEPNATNCFCAMEETPWKPCIFPPMPSHLSRFFCKSFKRILKLHIDHQRLSYCSTEWEPRWPETPKRQRFSLLGWCWMRKAASSPKFGERLWENRMKQHDYTRQKGTRSMLLPLEGKLRSCKPWCSWDPWKTQKASKSHGN